MADEKERPPPPPPPPPPEPASRADARAASRAPLASLKALRALGEGNFSRVDLVLLPSPRSGGCAASGGRAAALKRIKIRQARRRASSTAATSGDDGSEEGADPAAAWAAAGDADADADPREPPTPRTAAAMLRSEREAHERAGGCAFVAHAFALKQGRPPPPPPLPTRPSSPLSPGAAAAASAAAPTTATAAATKSAAVPGPPDLALLLEYHPGGDLAQLLARRRAGARKPPPAAAAAAAAARLDEREARFVAACALLALEALHSGGCIHRDVKPANLFVSRSGYAVLGDLGCAAVLPRAAPTPSMALVAAAAALAPARSPPGVPAAAAGPLTAAAAPAPWCIYGGRHCSAVSGTRGYMAPEVAASAGASAAPAPHGAAKAYGAAADLYSLGVALYELASGERPTPLVVAAVAAAASGETARGGTSAAAAGGETAAGADETAAGARAPPSPAEPILDPFPAHFSAGLRALLGALLSRDPARRPTAAGAQGAAWFAAFDWAALRGGTMSPPAALLAAAADGLGLSASEGTV